MRHDRGDILHDIVERKVLLLDLFRDQTDVGVRLERTLQCDMRGRPAHEFDEVPVFACRVTVARDVADQFRVRLGRGVKSEGRLHLVVLHVAVDRLRASDHLHAVFFCRVVFRQHAGVGVGVVATDDDERLDIEFAYDLHALLKLIHLFQFGASRSDHVEATRVAELLDEVRRDLLVVVIHQSARSHEETVEAVFGIQLFQPVEETADDVVSARCLSAREDDTHVDPFSQHCLTRLKTDERQAVCVGKQFLDLILIVHAVSGLTFFYLDGATESHW